MNLNMTQPENETQDFLLSISQNCETLIEQTHRNAEETLEFKLTKPREIFHFNPPILIEGSWVIGLTSLEVYNSTFSIREENNKFEIYTGSPDDAFSFVELKDKLAKPVGLSYISAEDFQHKIHGPEIIEAYRELMIKKVTLMVIIYYYWVILNHHFEILKVI